MHHGGPTFLYVQSEGDQGSLADAQGRAARGRLVAGEPGHRRDGRRDVDGGVVLAPPGRISSGRSRCLACCMTGLRGKTAGGSLIGSWSGRSCFRI